MISYDLSDVQEAIGELLGEMTDDPEFGDTEFGLGLVHIYAHLNRAWHQRNASEEDMENLTTHWEAWSRYPSDLPQFG